MAIRQALRPLDARYFDLLTQINHLQNDADAA
jgi:hypothetical protein